MQQVAKESEHPTKQATKESEHPTKQAAKESEQQAAKQSEHPTTQQTAKESEHPTMQQAAKQSEHPTTQQAAKESEHPTTQQAAKESEHPATQQAAKESSEHPATQHAAKESEHPAMQQAAKESEHPTVQQAAKESPASHNQQRAALEDKLRQLLMMVSSSPAGAASSVDSEVASALRRPNTVDFEALYAALPAGPTGSLESYLPAIVPEGPEASQAAMPPPSEIPKKALQALEEPAPRSPSQSVANSDIDMESGREDDPNEAKKQEDTSLATKSRLHDSYMPNCIYVSP